jgi:hypothetical protein
MPLISLLLYPSDLGKTNFRETLQYRAPPFHSDNLVKGWIWRRTITNQFFVSS